MIEAENQSSEAQYPPPPNSGILEKSSSSFESRKFLIVGGAVLLLLVPGLVAYVFAQNQTLKSQLSSPLTCEYQGQTYQLGEGFPSTDGCNNCSCADNGQVTCTEMACTGEELPLSIFSDWDTYKSPNNEYSLKYPPEAILNTYQEGEYEGISVSLIGPTQTASGRTQTELSEGYGMSIIEIPNIDAQPLAESNWDADNQSSDPEIPHSISKIKVIEIGAKTGYQYEVSNRGSAIVTFVPLSNTSLRIVGRHAGFTPKQEDEYYKILGQILSTFEFSDQIHSDNSKAETNELETIPIESTQNWQSVSHEGVEFKIPPNATFNYQSNPGLITWSGEYEGNTLSLSESIYIMEYNGGSRREQFYSRFSEDPQTCNHMIKEGRFGNVRGLQIANDGGWCQGGGGGTVVVVGDKLVILYGLNYVSDTGEITRSPAYDTIISTLKPARQE